jgi:hypothetical protein
MHPHDTRPSTRIPCPCLYCGTINLVFPSRVKAGGGRYCNPRCRALHLGPPKNTPVPLETRVWSRVDKTSSPNGCWLWTGTGTSHGYPTIKEGGRKTPMLMVSRLIWTWLHGPIPDGLFVCHNCPGGDNPLCVNPDHLFLGTAADNSADMVRKGLSAQGDRNGNAELTRDQVVEIRRRAAAGGVTYGQLAREYGCSRFNISAIVRRISWKNVP